MAKRTKRKISLGCLFWIAFIVLIAVLFFLNKDTISFVLDKTNARSIFLKDKTETAQTSAPALPEIQSKEESGDNDPRTGDGSKEPEQETENEVVLPQQTTNTPPAVSEKPNAPNTAPSAPLQKPQPENKSQITVQQNSGQTATPSSAPSKPADERTQPQRTVTAQQTQLASSSVQKPQTIAPVKPDTTVKQDTPTKSYTPKKDEAAKQEADKNKPATAVRQATIYWVRVDADGKLTPERATRVLPKSDAPMSDALETLFAAPTIDELKHGVRTLIPPGTKLRSAWVKDGVAFINVSEEFQFNQYGIDGALAQLLQVVFTATEFSTVKSVQFLIEGQKQEYLGAEGVWIGSPLSRTSF